MHLVCSTPVFLVSGIIYIDLHTLIIQLCRAKINLLSLVNSLLSLMLIRD